MDRLTPEQRSWNMSRIRSKDTSIEIKVRKYLFKNGFRFRKNDKRYPGKPDIVLPKYKTVIFVNGCFWHMHKDCNEGRIPKTNFDFWKSKMERNVSNDKLHYNQLRALGWSVIVLWECELDKSFTDVMDDVISSLLKGKEGYFRGDE